MAEEGVPKPVPWRLYGKVKQALETGELLIKILLLNIAVCQVGGRASGDMDC